MAGCHYPVMATLIGSDDKQVIPMIIPCTHNVRMHDRPV
jgi:hypothetical protein